MAGTYVYLNGKQVAAADAAISIFDYGFLFGAGVYDVALVVAGKLFQGTQHMNRFFHSAGELKIPIGESKEQLLGICEELVVKNDVKHGIVYLQV
jgi:D-alanine transaminase